MNFPWSQIIEETMRNYEMNNQESSTLLLLTHLISDEYDGITPLITNYRANSGSTPDDDRSEDDEIIKRVMEQSLRESEDDARIKAVFENPQAIRRILSKLEGVNPDDPIFNEFYKLH